MKILITAPSLDPNTNVSGIATVVQTIITHNKKHEYFHYLLGRPDGYPRVWIWYLILVKKLLCFPFTVKKEHIDIVHQNLPLDTKGLLREYVINMWCRLLFIPVVLHVHGGVFLMRGIKNTFLHSIALSLLKNSAKVIVLSELESKSLELHFNFKQADILHNSIDTKQYETHKNTPDNKLLFLGRIERSKGIEDIVQALSMLRKDIDFTFILCGTGPLKDSVISTCTALLGHRFEYRGIVSGFDKIKTIKEASVFLLPSRYGEGLPMALLETMAAGVVPIVTDDASMKYIIRDTENGIRVKKNNPNDLYQKLKETLQDKSLLKKLSQNAASTITRKHNINDYIVSLNNIYPVVAKVESIPTPRRPRLKL